MSDPTWERAEAAMRTRRLQLIDKPIDRIYGELLRAALPILAGATVEHGRSVCFHYWNCDGECGELRPAMARLARALDYRDPAVDDDIAAALDAKAAGIPVREG